jgi:hypothetical protein
METKNRRGRVGGTGRAAAGPAGRVVAAAWAIATGFGAILAPAAAQAWSAPGHRVVALVAERYLDGEARRELARIAGGESLQDTSVWLDVQRDTLKTGWPGSDRWHYDNRPVCDPGTPFSSQCADGNCPLAAYDRHVKVLADRTASREARLNALRVVVHLIGDAHQPLHAGDNGDRGGNDVNVDMGPQREPRSLHGNWDREFVDAAKGRESNVQFARRLSRQYGTHPERLQVGGLRDWLQESYEISQRFAYARLPGFTCGQKLPFVVKLPADYRDEAAKIAAERIARAGIRLAGVLNATLGAGR